MTFQDAHLLREKHLCLLGKQYRDDFMNQTDLITNLIVSPQDHPFYPEFMGFYKETGSYEKASELSYEKHGNDILYAVKCILDEPIAYHGDLKVNVIMDLKYVLKYINCPEAVSQTG